MGERSQEQEREQRPPAAGGVDWDEVFSSDTEDEEAGEAKLVARVTKAQGLKEQGNGLLQRGDLQDARAAYQRALALIWAAYRRPCGLAAPGGGESRAAAVELGTALDLNLALCALKLEQWGQARRSASRALEAAPGNAKALYRRGVASARLGLWDAAEDDLRAAQQLAPNAGTREELAAVQRHRAVQGDAGGGGPAVPKGFLAAKGASAGCSPQEPLGGKEEVRHCLDSAEPSPVLSPAVTPRAMTPRTDPDAERWWCSESDAGATDDGREWASGPQVHATLEEANGYLAAVASCRVRCTSAAERAALHEQLVLARKLMLEAQAAIDTAVVGPPGPDEPSCAPAFSTDLEDLLCRMAQGLEGFRPFWRLQERTQGEFDSLRVCRRLVPGSFDVELVRWGDAGLATVEDFTGALFPPLGKPADAASAAWQRELFHRVFQKDTSKYVAGVAWFALQELMSRGVKLHFRGSRVCDVGIGHGFFFAGLAMEGPSPPARAGEVVPVPTAARADALAICTGADRRVVALQSFTSLGVVHKWLLFAVEAEQDVDGGPAAGSGATPGGSAMEPAGRREMAADLCCGALGLLPDAGEGGALARFWDSAADDRFVPRCARWGFAAEPLAQPPQAVGPRRGELQRAAAEALLGGCGGLPVTAEDVLSRAGHSERRAAEGGEDFASWAVGHSDGAALDCAGRSTAARLLCRAVRHLGLTAPALAEAGGGAAPDDVALEAAQRQASEGLLRRKMREAGFSGAHFGGGGATSSGGGV